MITSTNIFQPFLKILIVTLHIDYFQKFLARQITVEINVSIKYFTLIELINWSFVIIELNVISLIRCRRGCSYSIVFFIITILIMI